MPRWLAEDLASMVAEWAERTRAAATLRDHLFLTRYGNSLNRDKFRENVVRPALRAAGLDDSLTNYSLRHSHASLLIREGADPLAIAHRMGHTDPGTTMRIYGHI
jgi:integrase